MVNHPNRSKHGKLKPDDVMEVGGGIEHPEAAGPHPSMQRGFPRSWYTVFRNGNPVHYFANWEDAMRWAHPGWEPSTNYEAQLDNR